MKKQKLPPFVPMFVYVMDSPAWLAMSPGARAFFLAFKKRYNRKTQQAVFLSARIAAKELRANKDTVSRWYHELQHFGFIMQVRGASFGPGQRQGGRIPARRRTVQRQAAEHGIHLLGRYSVLRFPVPKKPDGNSRFAHFSRPKNPDTSRKDSSHLLLRSRR